LPTVDDIFVPSIENLSGSFYQSYVITFNNYLREEITYVF